MDATAPLHLVLNGLTWPHAVQALGFTLQANMRLVSSVLGFWITLMTPVPGSKAAGAPPPVQLPQELCATLLELAGEPLQARAPWAPDPPLHLILGLRPVSSILLERSRRCTLGASALASDRLIA